MNALESDSPQELEDFKADLSRKTPCRAEKRKCIEAEIVSYIMIVTFILIFALIIMPIVYHFVKFNITSHNSPSMIQNSTNFVIVSENIGPLGWRGGGRGHSIIIRQFSLMLKASVLADIVSTGLVPVDILYGRNWKCFRGDKYV